MTKIDIFSGFLGAGKTTLIKKLIKEAYAGQQIVLIENEFGEIGIDGGFLQEAGIRINEMNSGCICCSLVGDFAEALKQVLEQYHPDRILIEPSGVGKLSDVIRAVQGVASEDMALNAFTTVVDANRARMYIKNFGEFFIDQVEHAAAIVLSHTDGMDEEKLAAVTALLREHNADAVIVTTPWSQLTGAQILAATEHTSTLEEELRRLAEEEEVCPVCGHHHHHDDDDDDDDDECCHHHHHDDDDDDDDDECCHHHHHDDDDDECCHHHHHDGDDDDHECCHHHHHDDDDDGDDDDDDHDHDHHGHHHGHGHHHHHADEVFTSFGRETTRRYTSEELTAMLAALQDEETFGQILRAKGIVAGQEGWIHFDYVPGEPEVRTGPAAVTGRLCVIGSKINEPALEKLFGLEK